MDDGGPYRIADTENCPTCKAPLPGAARTEPRSCAKGCGEWCDASMVEKQWGDTVDIPGDARLLWRHGNEKLACIACSQPMSRVVNSAWVAHRCREHGVWFVKQSRTHFERAQAEDIKRHLLMCGEAEKLGDVLHEMVAKDPRATRALAMRIIKLEDAVAQQRQWIVQLLERVRVLE